MRFSQLDRITALELGQSISAVKCLSLSEEYLKDHFPRFPVMPGVLMLESMFQASMWLIRATGQFQHSMVVLREGKSLKFQGFVQPGDSLNVFCEIKSKTGSLTNLKVSGEINGKTATSGRLVVDSFNLADREGLDTAVDEYMKHKLRLTFKRLCNQLETRDVSALANNPLAESASSINR
jgi:3-hydroxyacyl-[acyl-carrier-protein] dehydratase